MDTITSRIAVGHDGAVYLEDVMVDEATGAQSERHVARFACTFDAALVAARRLVEAAHKRGEVNGAPILHPAPQGAFIPGTRRGRDSQCYLPIRIDAGAFGEALTITTNDGPCECGEVQCDTCAFRYRAGDERCVGDPCGGECPGTCRAMPCDRVHVA